MVQTAQMNGNGGASDQGDSGFPYGLDPRDFGLSRIEYDRALRHHRDMEHHQVMHEQHDRHMKAMEWNRAERERIDAEFELKNWWLQPLNSFCKWFGGAFWVVTWAYCILTVMVWISDVNKKADDRMKDAAVKTCLADLEKCKSGLGAGWMKEAVK